MSTLRFVFLAVVLGAAILVAALIVNRYRPSPERGQPTPALASATGKCAECHRRETSALVHEFEMSQHSVSGVNCLDCHQPASGQEPMEHRGFVIAKHLTSKNCAQCHPNEYDQFARSRHAGASWAAIGGTAGFSQEQLDFSERYQPGWIKRPANAVGVAEGEVAVIGGCTACHSVGKPNPDGSFGSCTNCHGRHAASVALARLPTSCGQCHMGPDHSQIEIYNESKHGALFAAQRDSMNLKAPPRKLTTADMPVPTCATCHLSGLEGARVTHNPGDRLGWFLFAAVSTRRPDADRNQDEMKDLCRKCHTKSHVDDFYAGADRGVLETNRKVEAATQVMNELRAEGLVTATPFDDPIKFTEFDLWHYYGRTSKHGAYMGGPDFVQWHGNYELLKLKTEIDSRAAELRRAAGKR